MSEEEISDKKNIPYYMAAKEALMNWNGLSEEEADKMIEEKSFEEIESQVGAKGSIDCAIQGIKKSENGYVYGDIDELAGYVYEGKESKIVDVWKGHAEEIKNEEYLTRYREVRERKERYNKLIMDTLFEVHDGWVENPSNHQKFVSRDKKHQHLPSELIGWKEAKADLIFVKPIFEAAGIPVNEDELKKVYDERVKEFFLSRNITSTDELVNAISQGEEFYPALAGYGDILNSIKDPQYVRENIIPAIETKGIGKVEDVRESIVAQVTEKPDEKDVERLTADEQSKVEESLDHEVEELSEERDELQKKNAIVERITALAKKRTFIKGEIAEEEQKKNENINSFDEK